MNESNTKTILVIGKFYTEGFALHISETLQEMGHKVLRYEPGVKLRNTGGYLAKRQWQVQNALHGMLNQFPAFERLKLLPLLATAENNAIDLVIACHDFLTPQAMQQLKKRTKAPVILWFPDHLANFHRAFFLNADYDALFFKDPYIVNALGKILKIPIYYLPECCNPNRHCFQELSEEDYQKYGCDITTAGNLHAYRAAFFSRLKGYDVKIWGNPPPLWLDTHGIKSMLQNKFVANEEKAKAFRAAKIVINNLQPAEILGINVRTFEICASGGFQLIDERPGLHQLFEAGKELVSFMDFDDLKMKIDYYLQRDEERLKIARRGMERALRDHTYENRLRLLLETVFGQKKGFPTP